MPAMMLSAQCGCAGGGFAGCVAGFWFPVEGVFMLPSVVVGGVDGLVASLGVAIIAEPPGSLDAFIAVCVGWRWWW
jgi:hypothetical protein